MSTANQIDLTKIKPYGDTMNDGMMQFCFTLPVPIGEESKEAAKQLLIKMGMEEPAVVHAEDLGVGYTMFVMYGKCTHTIDMTKIEVPKVDIEVMDKYEVEAFIEENIKRPVVIVGACTGTDAHTVGIDAIMNMKGFAGHYGLERYEMVEAHNLGSQVTNEDFVRKAVELKADILLVSQTVTQKDVHITNLVHLVELLEAEGLREKVVLICGGPRITHELAKELGYDAGFGPGKYADDVATFAVEEMVRRKLG